jgi:pSer/pThr/pTyr-binding forkhead associated (FHA) protein
MKSYKVNGELIAVGGGDNIPLLRSILSVGRMGSCDICLRFPNISGKHCELSFREGYWYVRDLGSTNGVKVNGLRVLEKVLRHDDEIAIGKRVYTIRYNMPAAANRILEEEDATENVMGQSLLEKAGLVKPRDTRRGGGGGKKKPFDPADLPDER